jgi:UDP-N-acetylglucosamine 3-dehydrogenase
MLKVAVIGIGSMGQNHARIYADLSDVELVAVADTHSEQLADVARKYNTKPYTDYKKMFENEEIDAVSIAVPTRLHRDVTLFCLNLGKHVLLEKPISSNLEEANEIVKVAGDNNVNLMIGHVERFNPAVIELKNRIHELGEIYKIDVQRIGPFPGRITDVGVIIDLSVHDIDIINYLVDHFPTRVYAETQQRLHPNNEDSVTALLRYKNDMVATLNVNYLSPTKVRQLQVFGKKGMFKVNYISQELYFYENPGYSSDNWDTVVEGDMKKINIPWKEPLMNEIKSFIHCVREGIRPPVTGEQGMFVLKAANMLMQSAKEKRIIEVK